MTHLSPKTAAARLAAAEVREKKAQTALSRACEAKHAALLAVTKRHLPKVWEAEKMVREARAAVTLAELAAHGITPMQTIIECIPAGRTRRWRYVVRISREGWARLVPVGKGGAIPKSYVEQRPPPRWADARVTGETLREAPDGNR